MTSALCHTMYLCTYFTHIVHDVRTRNWFQSHLLFAFQFLIDRKKIVSPFRNITKSNFRKHFVKSFLNREAASYVMSLIPFMDDNRDGNLSFIPALMIKTRLDETVSSFWLLSHVILKLRKTELLVKLWLFTKWLTFSLKKTT